MYLIKYKQRKLTRMRKIKWGTWVAKCVKLLSLAQVIIPEPWD